jgi:hypothetical protein
MYSSVLGGSRCRVLQVARKPRLQRNDDIASELVM